MTKQEQIEEMAVDIAKRDCSLWEHCPKEPKYNCISQNPEIMLESSKNYVTIATWLVNAGYRKIDDNCAVITKAELKQYKVQAVKEFAEKLKGKFNGYEATYYNGYEEGFHDLQEEIDELLQEYEK